MFDRKSRGNGWFSGLCLFHSIHSDRIRTRNHYSKHIIAWSILGGCTRGYELHQEYYSTRWDDMGWLHTMLEPSSGALIAVSLSRPPFLEDGRRAKSNGNRARPSHGWFLLSHWLWVYLYTYWLSCVQSQDSQTACVVAHYGITNKTALAWFNTKYRHLNRLHSHGCRRWKLC